MRDILTIDFETYFSAEYSLQKMTTLQYVRDPRFHIFGCGVQINGEDPIWFTEMSELKTLLEAGPCIVVGHNLLFDALVLIERVGVDDAQIQWVDTLGLSKALLTLKSYSLAEVAARLHVTQQKMLGVLPKLKGVRDLSPDQESLLREYCLQDVRTTKAVYMELYQNIPPDELRLLDATIRWGIHARLVLDKALLDEAIFEAEKARYDAIQACGTTEKVLASNPQFAKFLQDLGLNPPVKISITTSKETWAFSKQDLSWIEFQNSHPEMSNVWKAREAVKSNLPITRAKTFRTIAETGPIVAPLQFYGAHTGRWSGRDGFNIQNLPRGGKLRKSIMAPEGHQLIIGDLSQIEVRMVAMLAGHDAVIEDFRNELDPYIELAKRHYKVETVTKEQRQFCKSCVLGLGYGMGPRKFADSVRKGFMGAAPVPITDGESVQTVQAYRRINKPIADLWAEMESLVLPTMTHLDYGDSIKWRHGCRIVREGILMPNGMVLQYPEIQESPSDFSGGLSYTCDGGGYRKNLYGGILVENLTQALARIVMSDALLCLMDIPMASNYPVAFTCHDEIVLIAPDTQVENAIGLLQQAMTTPPNWMPEIPLAATVEADLRYVK